MFQGSTLSLSSRLPLAALGGLLVALVAPPVTGAQQPTARGVADFEGVDPLAPELRKRVQALKGSAWDQRMARQFGQRLEMPFAEVESRLGVLAEWAHAHEAAGTARVVAFERRRRAIDQNLAKAASGRSSLDLALQFIEDVSWELQTKEEDPGSVGTVALGSSTASLEYTLGKQAIPADHHLVLVAPEGLRLTQADPSQEGYVGAQVGDTALQPASEFEPPDWLPADRALAWTTPQLDEGDKVVLRLAIPPSAIEGAILLVDPERKGALLMPPHVAGGR